MSTSPRCVVAVMEELLKTIPVSEVYLRNDIKTYHGSMWNQAPEARKTAYNWVPLQDIMIKHVQSIDEDWQKRAVQIFNGTAH